MSNQPALYGVIGLLTGVILASFTASYAVNHNSTGMMRTFGMHASSSSSSYTPADTMGSDMMSGTSSAGDMSMNVMVSELKGVTGDAFDKAFLTEMIAHHKGAIDMASLATTQGKHQEVKDLAKNIITAQTGEITQMQAWLKSWGY